MSDRKPVLRVTYKRGEQRFSVLSVWPGKYPGTYSVSADKGNDEYPAIGLIDVIKAFVARDGFVNVSVEGQREQRSQGRPSHNQDGFGSAPSESFDDDKIPF